MRPDRAERLAAIVEEALEREPGERAAFAEGECGSDADLRREVESLLGREEAARDFIETPAFRVDPELIAGDEPPRRIGETIGNYEILSLLGEGGMGEVYLARDRELAREVAIKLVRSGFATRRLIRHFRAEERILAGLNHPNIARLYGGGVTTDGVPYFVMEYVEGHRLDVFCSEGKLPVPARLRLFQKVCAAVSYAHQHLVIHRDLKPANIRVTPEGEPKLLDFGIAKLLDDDGTSSPEQTLTIRGAMTPDYASPEHVRGELVTTASDVYSLGVVLYEVLVGEKPARAAAATAFANAATRKVLGGDLENIVRMAMRDEPQRRYATVAQFSEDIGRHLAGLPVSARKDTWRYRTTKFVRRNKLGVAAAASIGLLLIGGILATTLEARRAEAQRARAERRFNEVRRLANSLMFEIHDSVQNLQGSTPTRRLIVTRALEFLDSLAQEAAGNFVLQRELATAYEKIGDIQGNPYSANLGDTDGAFASYRKALAIRERFAGKDTSTETQMELGRSFRGLGDIFEQKGDVAQSLSHYRRSLQIFEALAAQHPQDNNAQDELARAYETLGEGLARTELKDERVAAYKKTLEIRRRLSARNPSDPKLRRSTALAYLKVGSASPVGAPDRLESLRTGTAMLEALSAEDPNNARAFRDLGMAYYFTGTALTETGDFAGALEARQKAIAIRQQIATQDPKNKQALFDLAVGHGDLCESFTNIGSFENAATEGQLSLTILLDLTTADPVNAVFQRNLGLCYERLADAQAAAAKAGKRPEDWSSARAWYEKALKVFADLTGSGKLMPSDTGEVAKFTERIAECDRALRTAGR